MTGPALAQLPELSAPHDPELLLVRFSPEATQATRIAVHGRVAAAELKQYRYVNGLVLVRVPPEQLEATLLAYRADPDEAHICQKTLHNFRVRMSEAA